MNDRKTDDSVPKWELFVFYVGWLFAGCLITSFFLSGVLGTWQSVMRAVFYPDGPLSPIVLFGAILYAFITLFSALVLFVKAISYPFITLLNITFNFPNEADTYKRPRWKTISEQYLAFRAVAVMILRTKDRE